MNSLNLVPPDCKATVYLGRRFALPQAGLWRPLRGNSWMRPCSAVYGHRADTLVRNIMKLLLSPRFSRLTSFHHPSLALPVYMMFVHVRVATMRHRDVSVSELRMVI